MPRLSTVSRKLSRETDARRLLVRTLATQLVEHHAVTTTLPRAKVVLPYVERLTSRARRGDLAARRYVRARLDTAGATHHLVDVIAPQMKRDSGFLRLKKSGHRAGDHAPVATISYVDEIGDKPAAEPKKDLKKAPGKTAAKPKSAKKPSKAEKTV